MSSSSFETENAEFNNDRASSARIMRNYLSDRATKQFLKSQQESTGMIIDGIKEP